MAALSLTAACPRARASNAIVSENSRPGDTTWYGAVNSDFDFTHPPIEGYASATSVPSGGAIDFSVATTVPGRYQVQIVRLGWYGGSGGRRLTCLEQSALDPVCALDEAAVPQPPAPAPDRATGEVDARWRVTDHLRVPVEWVSGYYLAIFRLTTGAYAGYTGFAPFIVQAPEADRSAILVLVPTNTWQAYNTWGGESLYTTPEAVKVSFNRPYQHRHLFRWEYPLVRFLEREGYDVTYATDDDVDRDPSILLGHRLDLLAGHGEYWTNGERDAWEAARGHGVNLAFMGANTSYWQVRYEDGYRTMVSYKDDTDPEPKPALKTIAFRDIGRPECELLGEQYGQNDSEDGKFFGYTVTAAGSQDPWFAGLGLPSGSLLDGVVGFETDSLAPSCHVPPVTVLLHYPRRGPETSSSSLVADAVRYRACSGSEVFDAGSLFFSWALDGWRDPEYAPPAWPSPPGDVPALRHVVENMLADMLVDHSSSREAPVVAVRGGASWLAVDPGLPSAHVSVRLSAIRLRGNGRPAIGGAHRVDGAGRVRVRVPVPRGTLAVTADVSLRTGTVDDVRRYIWSVGARKHLLGAGGLEAAVDCYGHSAQIVSPVVGGRARRALALKVHLPGRFTVSLFQHGIRVFAARYRGAAVAIPADRLSPGLVSIVVASKQARLALAAVKA